MTKVQQVLKELKSKGWTLAAISDELEVHRDSVVGWEAGRHSPNHQKLVLAALKILLRKQKVPKRRRI